MEPNPNIEETMGAQERTAANGHRDVAESVLKSIDRSTTRLTRTSIFHILTFASIGASLALWFSGKRMSAIFVGLWPPTFEALKSAAEKEGR